jgi:hypothetical protein
MCQQHVCARKSSIFDPEMFLIARLCLLNNNKVASAAAKPTRLKRTEKVARHNSFRLQIYAANKYVLDHLLSYLPTLIGVSRHCVVFSWHVNCLSGGSLVIGRT